MGNFPTPPPNFVYQDMNYLVVFRDPAATAAARATYGYGISKSPDYVRGLFGISDSVGPWDPTAEAWIENPWAEYTLPSGPYVGREIFNPTATGITADLGQDWIVVPGEVVPGFGTYPDNVFIWAGIFITAAGRATGPVVPPPATAIQRRRWVMGFEMPNNDLNTGEGGEGLASNYCRDASRTPDGIGLAMRSTAGPLVTRQLTEYGAPTAPALSWERMYVRPRAYGAGSVMFWRCTGTTGGTGAEGARLNLSSGGSLEGYTIDNTGTATLRGTGPVLALNTWHRLDLAIQYVTMPTLPDPPGVLARFCIVSVYINGALSLSFNGVIHASVLTIVHGASIVGNNMTGANVMELDIDDWHNAEYPTNDGGASILTDGLDWISGSHVQLIRATDFGPASSVDWIGDWRTTLQNPAVRGQAALTSSTSGAKVEVETELDGVAGGLSTALIQLGAVAFVVGLASTRAGGTNTGVLGYNAAGGGDVLATITQSGTLNWQSAIYHPSGMIEPDEIAPLLLVAKKSTDGAATTAKMLLCSVECLGSWGPEDDEDPTDSPGSFPYLGVHNGPFPLTFLGQALAPPQNVVAVASGTYNGDSFGQDIVLAIPEAHWWWVRDTTSANGGTIWFSSLLGSHGGVIGDAVRVDLMVQALFDASTNFGNMRTVGAGVQGNASGHTYQYVAFCDQASRNLINGAFLHGSAVASADNALIDDSFVPDAVFFFQELLTSIPGTPTLWYKGPGNATTGASLLTASETAGVAQLAAGIITSKTPLHTAGYTQVGYAAFRKSDGSANALEIKQYTGDGTASRNIAVDLTDRSPLWALGVPMNGAAFVRDPSHTGTNSSTAAQTGSSTTAFIGGDINIVTVGIALNALGVVYSLFVIPGEVNPGGWSGNPPGGHVTLTSPGWSGPTGPTPGPQYPLPPEPPPPPEPECSDDWGSPRMDGLPYVPLLPE